ncbi:MAG: hypothetical protein QOD74_1382 [Variibacter sp.]|jgi:hypothetical protein|nr:hypothetical protein [Variibacter sp.]
MPPVIIAVVGAVGAIAFARWAFREARRVNAVLHPDPATPMNEIGDNGRPLRRDASGVYRPN